MSNPGRSLLVAVVLATLPAVAGAADSKAPAIDQNAAAAALRAVEPSTAGAAAGMIVDGRHTFRFDTFGDEAFWGDTIRLHEAIATVDPATALKVGLKVDVDALPDKLKSDLRHGRVDLKSPATTAALLQLNAVVGVTGIFKGGKLASMGVQCALCHSTVDNSFAPGIGHRLDGWANRDLDVGLIISLAPDLSSVAKLFGLPGDAASQDAVRGILKSWGPGKFDAELFLDGKSAPTLIPPAFGLAGVNLHTWTGWGSVTYWNAFVANLEMHGKGNFFDPRLDDPAKFPVAARAGFGHVKTPLDQDRITPKLAELQFYQLALTAPPAPAGSFDPAAAKRGETVFNGAGECSSCNIPPLFTEPGWNMHTGKEIGIDDVQSARSPDERYRTSPLKGLWTHQTGGFYHDGRFATLTDVVAHYDAAQQLGLTAQQQADLVQYLKSL